MLLLRANPLGLLARHTNKTEVAAGLCARWCASGAALSSARRFVRSKRASAPPSDADESKALSFKLVSYNVMANCYAFGVKTEHCCNDVLKWSRRRPLLVAELEGYGADVFCLQEVERDVFEDDFEPHFLARGFEALYMQKRTKVPGGNEEGVALFYRTDKFTRVASRSDLFANVFLRHGKGQFFKACKARGDAFVLALLRHNASGSHVVVSSLHLFDHWKWPDVRMAQMHALLQATSDFLGKQALPQYVPIVLAGSFNSFYQRWHAYKPERLLDGRCLTGGIHTLLCEGKVDQDHPHHPFSRNHTGKLRGYSHIRQLVFNSAGMEFDSAYIMEHGAEPPVTVNNLATKDCLDNIFLSRGDFEVMSTLEMPYDARGVRDPVHLKFQKLPNATYPSDRLAIGAELRFDPAKTLDKVSVHKPDEVLDFEMDFDEL